uniref:Uncharacterized protein n=1 Tax=Anguilla anguilla TaxID=7936 RepID=A0A0E9WAM2_ANGAN
MNIFALAQNILQPSYICILVPG